MGAIHRLSVDAERSDRLPEMIMRLPHDLQVDQHFDPTTTVTLGVNVALSSVDSEVVVPSRS